MGFLSIYFTDFTGWELDNAEFEAEFEKVARALQTDGVKETPQAGKQGLVEESKRSTDN